MSQNRTASAQSIIANLAEAPRVDSLNPIAARFVCAVRLIAVHERSRVDPIPELAAKLGSVDLAAKSLALAKVITRVWPENIHISRFCCEFLSHDEVTIGNVIESATARDRDVFEQTVETLIRPCRRQSLWDAANDLVMAELSGA